MVSISEISLLLLYSFNEMNQLNHMQQRIWMAKWLVDLPPRIF
jgi:hypothetical protein